LAPTPVVAGPNENARGFSYFDVNLVATVGASLEIFWIFHEDYDNLYTYGFDKFGNLYDHSANFHSLRPLVAYEVTPLPATLPLFVAGLGALGLLGWRRKRKPI
jgi:hypothetical protein